jgi:hypothetical protein
MRIALMLLMLTPTPAVRAQSPASQPAAAQDVTIIIQQQQVRFTAQRAVEEIRLQVFNQTGETIYDSGVIAGPELNWPLHNANGEAVKSGLYAYTLSIKETGAENARERRGHFIVDRAGDREGNADRLWITSQGDSSVGTELTVARSEENTVAGAVITNERTVGEGRGANGREGERKVEPQSDKPGDQASLKASTAAASGTVGRIAKFTTTTDLGDSGITETSDGKVGIGTTTPFSKLAVKAAGWGVTHTDGVATLGTWVSNNSAWFGTVSSHDLHFFTVNSNSPRMTLDTAGNVGIGTTSPQQKLHVDGNEILSTGGAAGFKFRNRGSASSNDDWVWYSQDNIARLWRANVGNLLSVAPNGNVGIGIEATNPDRNVTVRGFGGAYLNIKNRSGMFGSFDNQEVLLGADVNGGIVSTMTNHDLQLRAGGNSTKMVIKAGGNVGIGTLNPVHKLHAEGGGGNGVYGASSGNANNASGVSGNNTGGGWGVSGFSNGFGGVFGFSHAGNGNGVFGLVNNNQGSGVTGRNDGSGNGVFGYSVNGTGVFGASEHGLAADFAGRTRTRVLEITGGADFAESFDINLPEETAMATEATGLQPGLVVSIDPATPGKLALATQAYDRRVAGIISGAGGVKPGMVMGQEGTLADGKYPVALSGRVYCWVDASQGAVEPGDLLTTSATAGHAMKVTDSAKAQGAIIGKAMTGLKEGKGLVLVLVTLQ